MAVQERFKKASELLEEESFLKKLANASNNVEVQALFADNGVQLSLDDIDQMVKESEIAANVDDCELNEDELGNVAGGIIITTTLCFVGSAALLGFFTSYGYRTIKAGIKSNKKK